MRRCRLIQLLVAIAFLPFAGAIPFSASAFATASVKPVEPRCEYLVNPLGLDVPVPRLSWKLEAANSSARGQRQTSYQILVAGSAASLSKDQGDLWDSGVVKSDESVNIPYAGKALVSAQQCFWKVRVTDEKGRLSPWGQPARWTTGLMNAADWKAQWIGTDQIFVKGKGSPPPDNAMPDPWLRKTFELSAPPTYAIAYVASVGYHELYVNGQKVGDAVLAPSATDNKLRARYVTYDITRYLKLGRNVIGLWLGVSWSIFPSYQSKDKPSSPIVLAQADIQLADGAHIQVVTDETWKTHPSPNTLLGVWDFMNYGGELYDAKQEVPDWCAAGLDDSTWKRATVFHPNLVVSADKTEPNRLVKEIKPLAIVEATNGVYRVDMGVNYAGWFEIQLSGQPGDRVEFRFSERPDEAMTHRLHSAYIIGPGGQGTFRNHFNYGVGRWIEIKGLRRKPSQEQIRGWLVRTDYQRAAQFECDQPLLNRIYQTTLWTFENLSLGGYVVDCPQRERMGYGGDAHATTRTALNNFALGAFYTKWSEDWRDVQSPDGNLPYTAPTYWGGGGPGWSGFCITLPWEFYRRYGDRRILEQNFPMMQRWLAFLETKSANNLLKRWGGEWDFLGDWLWPGASGVNGDTRESLFFNDCYWVCNLQTAAAIADILGKNEAAEKYRQRAASVRQAIHAQFFNATDNSYVNGFPAYLAIALAAEVPPGELRPATWKRLEQEILVNHGGHIHAGITGGAFLFKVLLENNRNDLIYVMASKEDYPSWGKMLKGGATTFYEDWEGKLSCLHSSYLSIGSWFIEGLGGIRLSEAGGFKRFIIEPWIDRQNGPHSVKARYDSLYGTIVSQWTLKDKVLRLTIGVPPNTEALLRLHDINPESLRENGRRITEVQGVSLALSDDKNADMRLEAGQYQFAAAPLAKP